MGSVATYVLRINVSAIGILVKSHIGALGATLFSCYCNGDVS